MYLHTLDFLSFLDLVLGWIFWHTCVIYRDISLAQGVVTGHAYYFLEDVYPKMTGRRPLRTPAIIQSLFADEPAAVRFAAPAMDDAPPR
ncbi:hypothetical protein SASPL_144645 [Salvia splendens]|uniref:Derlin n=1 Tax=Salvia splendens TaxID=180675 RepID=A0A8X8WHK1_SALSN|nr:hypothetical protein SASPL_144645 [Salvia splendens]